LSRREILFERVRRERVLAIVRAADRLDSVVEALWGAGIGLVEVALTSPGALDAIRQLSNRGTVGAGTVRSREDGERALEAGASFLVSPGTDPDLVAWAAAEDIPHLPGVFTPTEIETARNAGAGPLKLFPASLGGPKYVAALLGPFPDAELVPTGGVGPENAAEYLEMGAIAVAVGQAVTGARNPELARGAAARLVEMIGSAQAGHPLR
jgi:2-dehydro-3-deoxyphosphogluconate aldolase/(4S)-4-hydroxy-2-oxoglutarate aldolase